MISELSRSDLAYIPPNMNNKRLAKRVHFDFNFAKGCSPRGART
jgi:hypothetical protein